MAENRRVEAAAERLRDTLHTAKKGGFYRHAWYAYMHRSDIEVLVENILGPEPLRDCYCDMPVLAVKDRALVRPLMCGTCGGRVHLRAGPKRYELREAT